MADSKKQKRRIVVDGNDYIWRFNQGRDDGWATFRAYAADVHSSPLSILFPAISCSSGVPTIAGCPEVPNINLYKPASAAKLIRHGLANGWEPQMKNVPLTLQGVEVLTAPSFMVAE